jgi:hypothetical protein
MGRKHCSCLVFTRQLPSVVQPTTRRVLHSPLREQAECGVRPHEPVPKPAGVRLGQRELHTPAGLWRVSLRDLRVWAPPSNWLNALQSCITRVPSGWS